MKKILTGSAATALALGAGLSFGNNALADQVILDDLIVDGSICAGLDCVNGESFGFDTLRLKENNLRIKFQDTSSSASFPTNDWQITANDSSNGGQNKFSIDDIDGGRTPFTILAGAPSHSLFVNASGRLGLGTATPVTNIHVVTGNTPTLRLEQNGSSGFTPQTWDLAGNEANFFIRDATNGSKLPFRIFPNAPSNSLTIEGSTGDVGVGTTSPEADLHVVATNQDALIVGGNGTKLSIFESTNQGAVQIRIRSDSTNRRFLAVNDADAVKTQIVFGDNEIKLAGATDSGGNLWATINASGIVTQGPDCSTPCDGVFRPSEYTVESIEDHAEYMWKNKHLQGVGPTSPDLPYNVTTKTAGILHELEKAHIYIEQLNKRLATLENSGSR